MPKYLTLEQIGRYREDGVLFPVSVLPSEQIDESRKRLDAIVGAGAEASLLKDYLGYKTNLVYRWVDDIAHTLLLLDVVEDLIGPDILLWSCSFAIKQPRSPGRYTWHQDVTYWGLTPPIALTCWLAFGVAGPHNGGVRYLRGSHNLGLLPHRNTFSADNFLSRGQEIEKLPAQCAEVAATLEPGEISIHDGLTAHCSGPNESNEERIGCLLTFIPTYVRHERVRESAMLMRGRDRFGYHDLERRPEDDLAEADILARQAAMRKMGTFQEESSLQKPTRAS